MVNFTQKQINGLSERGVSAKFFLKSAPPRADGSVDPEAREWLCRIVANSTGSLICEGFGNDQKDAFEVAFANLIELPMVNYDDPVKQLADAHAEIDRLRKQVEAGGGTPPPPAQTTAPRRGRPPRKLVLPVPASQATTPQA